MMFKKKEDESSGERKVTPEMRMWFFEKEGWYADDETISKAWDKKKEN